MNRNTKKDSFANKKGFLTVEAAILLPVFIIAILTIGYLIKVVSVEENIMHAMADEARKLSTHAYNFKIAPAFERSLQKRLSEENRHEIEIFEVETFNYLFRGSGKDDLISVRVNCFMQIKLPIIFYKGFDLSETLLFRGFTGIENIPEELNYDDMEEEKESNIVWVFPVAGEKYHESGCGYIQVAAKQGVLDQRTRNSYKPCSICHPGEMSNGSIVYYFDNTGKAYHSGNCYIVDRFVISMEEEDAIKKGYTPCSKCN